jgi:hypothetical protein
LFTLFFLYKIWNLINLIQEWDKSGGFNINYSKNHALNFSLQNFINFPVRVVKHLPSSNAINNLATKLYPLSCETGQLLKSSPKLILMSLIAQQVGAQQEIWYTNFKVSDNQDDSYSEYQSQVRCDRGDPPQFSGLEQISQKTLQYQAAINDLLKKYGGLLMNTTAPFLDTTIWKSNRDGVKVLLSEFSAHQPQFEAAAKMQLDEVQLYDYLRFCGHYPIDRCWWNVRRMVRPLHEKSGKSTT